MRPDLKDMFRLWDILVIVPSDNMPYPANSGPSS